MLDILQSRAGANAPRMRLLFNVALFGFASGLPLALTGSTLQAWLTTAGVDLQTLGALSLVGLPYLYKFLWAPLLDRYGLGALGRRRGWLVLTQLLLAGLLFGLSGADPARNLEFIVWLVVLLALVSATQDIVVDAWRAEILSPADRGLGSGLSVAGYRVAMIVSGAGALLVADRVGFGPAFMLLAGLMAALALCSLVAPEPARDAAPPTELWTDFRAALAGLLARPGIVWLAAFIALYKLGDAFAGSLSMSFFLRGQGFSLTEIGTTYKLLGMVASILGGICGGLWMPRLGLYRALLWFGVLQAVTNIGFLLLAMGGKSWLGMVVVVALENFSGGMGTSVLVALMVGLCAREFTATHFALLSALASLSRVLIGPLAGDIAVVGWVEFFAASLVLAIPGLLLLVHQRDLFRTLDTPLTRPAA